MSKKELQIITLTHSVTQTHSFSVMLGEVNGNRRLPIVIGGFEAQAIAVALDNMKPSRPLTHDLLKSVFDVLGVQLDHIYICKLIDGVFFSFLICKKEGELIEIDSRTSDALALAVRFDCPIYVEEEILKDAGIIAEGEEEFQISEKEEQALEELAKPGIRTDLKRMTKDELEEELLNAIENEDYEKAARVRDELNKRE